MRVERSKRACRFSAMLVAFCEDPRFAAKQSEIFGSHPGERLFCGCAVTLINRFCDFPRQLCPFVSHERMMFMQKRQGAKTRKIKTKY
jgi:hypothetical protein